jgi:hypothetical protein
MVLIQRFCNRLRLRWRLQNQLSITHQAGDYPPCDLLLALLYALIAGLRRINQTEILQYNGTFLSLLGLEQFPNQTTLRRFLQRLPPAAIRQLVRVHDELRQELFGLPTAPTTLIFDLDSVVLTVYGHQQGARVGYNPKKRGRRSYHPLLCFEAQRQEFWHGSLRPGDVAANTGVIHFLQWCLAKVPSHLARSRLRMRADAGFFSGKFIGFLDRVGVGYVIVAQEHRTIRQRALAVDFTPLQSGAEVGEFQYQPLRWNAPHRFVVIRRPIPEDPAEAAQLTLFQDRRYAYTVLVTNLELEPWRVWTFYRPRAIIKKDIRELLYDSDPRLDRQCRLLPNRVAGVQSGALVQALVFAAPLCQGDRGNGTQRFSSAAGQTGTYGAGQCAASAQGLPLPSGFSRCGQAHRQITPVAKKRICR